MSGAPGIFFDLPGFSLLRSPQDGERMTTNPSSDVSSLTLPPPSSRGSNIGQNARGAEQQRPNRRREMDRHFVNHAVGRKGKMGIEEMEEWDDGRGGGGGGQDDKLQELHRAWFCSTCTLRNEPERMSCQACGKINCHREKLRALQEEQTQKMLQRNLQEQEELLDSFRDLEDLEEEEEVIEVDEVNDDDIIVIDDEGKGQAPSSSASSSSSSSYSKADSTVVIIRHPLVSSQPLKNGQSPIRSCPSELLLYCLSFLNDPLVYTRLREVAKSFVRLAEHETLWKPLAQLHCRPKEKRRSSMCHPPIQGAAATPSSSSSQKSCAAAGGAASKGDTEERAEQNVPASWSCKACGLIQVDPFGLNCEFCSAQREIITSPPANDTSLLTRRESQGSVEEGTTPLSCFRVIASYNELAQIWAAQREKTGKTEGGGSGAGLVDEKPLYSEEKKRKADAALEAEAASMVPREGKDGLVHMAGQGKDDDHLWQAAIATGDWYFFFKAHHIDQALAAEWDTLHRGWEWLVDASRKGLRTRLCCNREQIMARDDSCLPITESFQKVVNKLTKRNWVLLWESMRTEFCLQAEALRRDVIRHMKALRIGEMGVVRAYRTFLEDILHIWDVYQAWVFEIDGFFGRLNDQVCGERYRATTTSFAACGVAEANTPYVGEASLLAFRDHFLMHHSIRLPLIRASEGDDSRPFSSLLECFDDDDHAETMGGSTGGSRAAARSNGLQQLATSMEMSSGLVEPEEMDSDQAVVKRMNDAVIAAAEAEASSSLVVGEGDASVAISTGGSSYYYHHHRGSSSSSKRIVENIADLIERLTKMAEEMDVPDDPNAPLKHRQAYERLVLRPLRNTMAELRIDGKTTTMTTTTTTTGTSSSTMSECGRAVVTCSGASTGDVAQLLRGDPRNMMIDEDVQRAFDGHRNGKHRKRNGEMMRMMDLGGGGGRFKRNRL